MTITSYTEQLKNLAELERVDLFDAIQHAGVGRATYYRSIEGGKDLRLATAESIANAIKELSAR